MEIVWREEDLQFRVHLKPNQLLKYLNKGSAHTPATFKSIQHRVLRQLATLTSANHHNNTSKTGPMTTFMIYGKWLRQVERNLGPIGKDQADTLGRTHLLSILLSIARIAAPAMKSERNSKQLSHQQLSGKATDFAVQDLHD
jgi:hypothetical protein